MRGHSYDARELCAIFLGGCLGALLRAALAQLPQGPPGSWPWTTFSINLAGCFLLGYFTTRLQERLPLSLYRRPLLGTGFCGALTTFSTFEVELLRLIDVQSYGTALGYAAASICGGFVSMTLATAMVRRVRTLQ